MIHWQTVEGIPELHLDHKAARMLAGTLVRTCPQGQQLVDLGTVVRIVVHGTPAEPREPHVPVGEV
jgi:hypothetical protein